MKKAVLLLETQIALFICLSVILFFATTVASISKFNYSMSNLNTLIGLYQLSDDLNVCYDLEIGDKEIVGYLNPQESFEISLNQNRLVKTPGFNIYLYNIEEVRFYVIHDFLYLTLNKDGKYYEYKLIYSKR